ncbi:hypothetical protein [Arachnia propionica]|uniref:Uncharacterized protein n=1 Tax=Arachnia propionica TaxID=1750 RepID=A0A3P1WNG9_9ACTN|nr:hypothetical protein [Arachnia propionica]RRD47368.1 hypothetical protein EII35_15080 [Arachnia propionica]
MMPAKEVKLLRAGFWLRRFQKELRDQGTPFIELEWREGVDLWPRYAAWTHIGRISAEYNGSEWILSLALPEAKYFATYADWAECLYGPIRTGYSIEEAASVFWLRKLLKDDDPPQIDVDALDRVAERRKTLRKPTRIEMALFYLALAIGLPLFSWWVIAADFPLAGAAIGTVAVGVLSVVGSLWRVHRRRKKLGYTSRKKEG